MDFYPLAIDLIERVATSVIAGVIVSEITRRIGNKKKFMNPLSGIETLYIRVNWF